MWQWISYCRGILACSPWCHCAATSPVIFFFFFWIIQTICLRNCTVHCRGCHGILILTYIYMCMYIQWLLEDRSLSRKLNFYFTLKRNIWCRIDVTNIQIVKNPVKPHWLHSFWCWRCGKANRDKHKNKKTAPDIFTQTFFFLFQHLRCVYAAQTTWQPAFFGLSSVYLQISGAKIKLRIHFKTHLVYCILASHEF